MNYKKEILKRAAFGIPIGIATGATISLVIAIIMQGKGGPTPEEYRGIHFYLISYIVSLVIGAVFAGSSVIWEVEKLSLRTQTVLHFCITLTTHLSCALIANWIPFKLTAVLLYAGIYISIYIVVYLITYFVQKKRVQELNQVLEK